MKKVFFIAFVIISSACFGQKKTDSLPPKPDSVTIVVSEIARFAYDKISAKDFDILKGIIPAFLQQHEATKPKKIVEPKK